MTEELSTGMIGRSILAVEKVRKVLDFDAIDNDRDHDSTLGEIMHLVDMPIGVTSDGWTGESARLFAVDLAMTAIRRNLRVLAEQEKQILLGKLQEARTLVVSGRDGELGFIQAALETHLVMEHPGRRRRVWLTAMDALIPSPYRAALVSTRNALRLGATEAFADLHSILRDRLLARLGEGSLISEPTTFDLTA